MKERGIDFMYARDKTGVETHSSVSIPLSTSSLSNQSLGRRTAHTSLSRLLFVSFKLGESLPA